MKCYFDSQPFQEKPSAREIKTINYNLCDKVLNLSNNDFISFINKGHTLVPSVMFPHKRSQKNFMFTNLLLLDFDNATKVDGVYKKSDDYFSIQDCLNLQFTKDNAFILYESFSSTEDINRFRLVFLFENPIFTQLDFDSCYKKLLSIYPQADKACNDSARLFFGAKNDSVIVINPLGLPDTDFLDDVPISKAVSDYYLSKSVNSSTKDNISSNSKITKYIANNDLYALKKHLSLNKLSLNSSYIHESDFWSDFNKLNMYKLFGLPSGSFCCILYPDKNPSCSVLRLANKDYIYKRFSESNNFALNNFSLFEKLFVGDYFEMRDFVLSLFGSSIVSIKSTFEKVNLLISLLKDSNTKISHPRTYKILHHYSDDLQKLLYVMFGKPIAVGHKYKFISLYASRTLAHIVFGSEMLYKRIQYLQHFLQLMNIIRPLSNKHIQALDIKNFRIISNENKKRQNIYLLQPTNINIDHIENRIKHLNLASNFSLIKIKSPKMKSSTKKETKKITDQFISDIEDIVIHRLDEVNYVLDSEIKSELILLGYSQKRLKKEYINSTNIILDKHKLNRQTINKKLINLYKIDLDKNSKSKIIYRNI